MSIQKYLSKLNVLLSDVVNNAQLIQLEEEKLALLENIYTKHDIDTINSMIYQYRNLHLVKSINTNPFSTILTSLNSTNDTISNREHKIKSSSQVAPAHFLKDKIMDAYQMMQNIKIEGGRNILSVQNQQYCLTKDLNTRVRTLYDYENKYKIVYDNNGKYIFSIDNCTVTFDGFDITCICPEIKYNCTINVDSERIIGKYKFLVIKNKFIMLEVKHDKSMISYKIDQNVKNGNGINITLVGNANFYSLKNDLIFYRGNIRCKVLIQFKNKIFININIDKYFILEYNYYLNQVCSNLILDNKIDKIFTSFKDNLRFIVQDIDSLFVSISSYEKSQLKLYFDYKDGTIVSRKNNLKFNNFLDLIYYIYDNYNKLTSE